MIKIQNRTPSVLAKESRDYQLLCRIFDSCINSSKLATDTILNIPTENLDYRFIDLACKTVGFDYKNDHDYKELIRIVRSFKEIMFKKGTKEAIEKTISLVLNSQGISDTFYIYPGAWTSSSKTLDILLPKETGSTTLIDDIFDYILPAGWTYNLIKADISSSDISDVELTMANATRRISITDHDVSNANYLTSSNNQPAVEDLSDLSRVPLDSEGVFIAPAVDFDTVISGKPA